MSESQPFQFKLSDDPENPPEILYIKSTGYRVIHCDGALGAITRQGILSMALYSERIRLPDKSVLEFDSEQQTVKERAVGKHRGIVREIEVQVMLSLESADAMRAWLEERVNEARGSAK